jgi:hypothetical protein
MEITMRFCGNLQRISHITVNVSERKIFQTNIVKKNKTNINLNGYNNAVATIVLAPDPYPEAAESSPQSRTVY